MFRAFKQHEFRNQASLCGLWTLTKDEAGAAPQKTYVPGCWEQIPGMERYRGKAVYRKSFSGGGNLRLVFKGVSHTARVLLDGKPVGTHYNAYTPFAFVARDVPTGEHQLEVEVDNRFGDDSALHVPNDYMSYGGITRGVCVEQVPDVYIETVHFTPSLRDGVWHGTIRATVVNLADRPHEAGMRFQLAEETILTDRQTVSAGGSAVIETTHSFAQAKPYTCKTPTLYLLEAWLLLDAAAVTGRDDTPHDTVILDDLIERVGFREVSVRGGRIIFGGESVYIKGFNRHEDHGNFGCALPPAAMDHDLQLLQDLGANAVRTSHYPNDEYFLDLCDERGILVWEEGHARGLSLAQMLHPNFDAQSADCITEMITSHYNHPSIFVWGILNECASHAEEGRACYAKQYALIRALDASRPTTSATFRPAVAWFGPNARRKISAEEAGGDICLDLCDIVSFNIYPRWYFDEEPLAHIRQVYEGVQGTGGAGKPFLISEIGAGAIYGYRSPTHDKWTEERQAEILREQIEAVFAHEKCSGVFLWQFCDTRVSEEIFAGRPKTMNNKGIVDAYRRPKLAYDVVKALFGGHA